MAQLSLDSSFSYVFLSRGVSEVSLIDNILKDVRTNLAARKVACPMGELKRRIADADPTRSLSKALRQRFSVIAELKDKSPSAGLMAPRNLQRALPVYKDAPFVSAISVLTDKAAFGGSVERLARARETTGKPVLRKDFIEEEYQVYEARAFGADAILLMASLHVNDAERLRGLFDLAESLGLEALVEIGMAGGDAGRLASIVPADAQIWGVNSRMFKSTPLKFRATLSRLLRPLAPHLDLTAYRSRHRKLKHLVPNGRIAVAESGIHTADDLQGVVEQGYQAALIGTAFLKGPKPIEAVVEGFGKRLEQIATLGYAEFLPSAVRSHA